MSEANLVYVPGICAGHPEHPELLWVFVTLPSGKLLFQRIEIDFPEPAAEYASPIQVFDVDMSGFQHCPYCESTLYFFCKRCHHLSCFDWSQVSVDEKWTCFHCLSQYRMKVKTTPFRVVAQAGSDTVHYGETMNTSALAPSLRSQGKAAGGSLHTTQIWHPKRK